MELTVFPVDCYVRTIGRLRFLSAADPCRLGRLSVLLPAATGLEGELHAAAGLTAVLGKMSHHDVHVPGPIVAPYVGEESAVGIRFPTSA